MTQPTLEMSSMNLRVLPREIEDLFRPMAENPNPRDGRLIGWRTVTESTETCTRGCLAPGSSPHSHSIVVGYLFVFEKTLLQVDTEGFGVRSSSLHPFPERKTWHINAYEVGREYGGPEEGGWWYDTGTLVPERCYTLDDATQDEAAGDAGDATRVAGQASNAEAVPVVSSVHYRGGRYVFRAEEHAGADWPAERPVYS